MEEISRKFYITTAIPYVNSKPHPGHALEFVQTDVIARHRRILGQEVLVLSGADENAIKNVRAAEEAGVDVQKFIDQNAKTFLELAEKLNAKFDVFQKGSDKARHYPSSQKLWELCAASGDIYKKSYHGLYCVGCETFYNPEELTRKGECFEHPWKKLEKVSEENYFFRLSKYQTKLKNLISSDTLKIIPETRKKEILSFLGNPLQDISISRTNERAKNWGVPVPGDDTQRIYVWFDALNIYQSGIGFGWDEEKYRKWWPADVHVIGKDITRFHAIYWPAFLLSAGLSLPKSLFVHGFLTVDGQKMSKTLGNVVDPFYLIEKYGVDPLRYYLLREIPAGEDGDFSEKKLVERYNGELANGLGNLVSRVVTLGEKIGSEKMNPGKDIDEVLQAVLEKVKGKYHADMREFRFNEALADIWTLISFGDKYMNESKPWAFPDSDEFRHVLLNLGYLVSQIGELLLPFLPETAEKIKEQIAYDGSELKFKKGENMFPRLI